ncbi:MAG: aldo/keto reductase [Nitrososphaerota archaeon]|jgi:aryl-alcohol dehydrogenase (NADP+)|nr:aldo/keto reductase [Nitrososphaerota archaeon]MDG6953247.1 aldo/keto reductase [Nitrososphaerota archaeon]MDG6956628.1 aldo/keto reductase [Nitrososphaerota archaeon]MDG6957975.1 aldo/keto reductase [Nitrososphaerota archaeon]MDG6960456.1 aldo/keto reductase [Nitrososphaerota archaeon]
MEFVRMGQSGLRVSRICLGCMSFGTGDDWRVDGEAAKKVLSRAWDLGINFYDTANVYSNGRSEEIVGEFLDGRRDDAVLATKVRGEMGPGPNQHGLSRAHIMWQLRESLRRLKTDHVDLYQIHRWDYDTPIEETLSTMTDLVSQGKVRYIGASSMWAWQFAKALYTSDVKGFARFVTMQDLYNLLYREEEREMIPLCKAEGVGLIPWSPTAAGILSGKYFENGKLVTREGDSKRISPGSMGHMRYVGKPQNDQIVGRLVELAKQKGATPNQVALAWLLKKGVTAPIIGTSKVEHLEEMVGAVDVKLTDDEAKHLEEPYVPQPVIGFT